MINLPDMMFVSKLMLNSALVLMIPRISIIASIIFDLLLFITSELKSKGVYSCLNRNIYGLLLSFVIEYENGTVARHHMKNI